MSLWMHLLGFAGGLGVLAVPLLQAQTTPAACETQVQEQYKTLVQDQLTPPLEGWQAQLTQVVTQLRMQRTTIDLKRAQVDQVEQNLVTLLERQRQLHLQLQAAQAELERLKASPPQN